VSSTNEIVVVIVVVAVVVLKTTTMMMMMMMMIINSVPHYVLSQQPQGRLQRQHRNIRKIQKYKQQTKTHKRGNKKSRLRITV
jgi:hypothetical protein